MTVKTIARLFGFVCGVLCAKIRNTKVEVVYEDLDSYIERKVSK